MTISTRGDSLDANAVIAAYEASVAPIYLAPHAVSGVAERANDIACALLEKRGNILSIEHRKAMALVTLELAQFAAGIQRGRRAYALPTGMGKTTAAVALIAALNDLGHADVAITVTAAQVQSLEAFRKDLLECGVPDEAIGLKHAGQHSDVRNSRDQSRLYQLVTHVRVHGRTDIGLVEDHLGRQRALCIYDETLWRADTTSLRLDAIRGSIGFLESYQPLHPLARYVSQVKAKIASALDLASDKPGGVMLELPRALDDDIEAWADWLKRDGVVRAKGTVKDDLMGLLSLVGQPVRIISTGQGKGLISVRDFMPSGLTNVAILDASTPIRELVKLDPSITMVEGLGHLKSFENVQVFQRLTYGGRSSLRQSPTQLANEVTGIIGTELEEDPDRSFLIFTFKAREGDNPQEHILKHLTKRGIEPPRLSWRPVGLSQTGMVC